MAERRMFAKTIIDSDAFIDMPVTARLLYYDLSMRADDDGFVNSPKKIMKMIGASQEDLDILVNQKFIIGFDNGIVVIKHWRIHNYIRKDTYNSTPYHEEKDMLELDENKAYRLTSTSRRRAVHEPSTQVRLGKDNIEEEEEAENELSYQQIVDNYNKTCKSLSPVIELTVERRNLISDVLLSRKLLDIYTAFDKAEKSNYLRGANKRGWKADFDWIMANILKVLEGKYDNGVPLRVDFQKKSKNAFNNFSQRNYSEEEINELEKRLLSK